MEGNDAGYWLQLHSDGKSVITGGTGEVTVNYHVYNIGYWGNGAALAMMDEIRGVIDR